MNKKSPKLSKVSKKIRFATVSKKTVLKRRVKRAKIISRLGGSLAIFVLLFVTVFGALSLKPSINSDILSATTSSDLPLAPTNLVAKVVNSTVTLTWGDNSPVEADKYVVYRYDTTTGEYIKAPDNQILSAFSKKYISSENDSGKTYIYKVAGARLTYAAGTSVANESIGPMSKQINVKIPVIKAPKTPKNLRAKVKNSQITFSWSGSADGYEVERYDVVQRKYVSELANGDIVKTSFSKRAYEPGKTYKFRVSAYNNIHSLGQVIDVLSSVGFASITIRIPQPKMPATPTGLKSVVSDGAISLSWANPSRYTYSGMVTTDISGVDGYDIMIYSDVTKTWTALDPSNYKFESDRVVDIYNQSSGDTKQYKIRGYKKVYSESTREITNLNGPYSKSISVKMP